MMLFLLVSLVKGLSILFIFSKNQLLYSLIICIIFLDCISFISAMIFIIYFLLLTLGFVWCSFSSSCKCEVRLFIWVFRDRPITLWISFLGLCSWCPTDFGLLCPYLHFFQGIFWFLPWSHCWPIHCLITCYFAPCLCMFFSVLVVTDF